MKKNLITALFILMTVGLMWGQVNISAGSTISQDFTIGTSATATLPAGWKADKNSTVRLVGTYASAVSATERRGGNSLSSTAGNGIYNFGAGLETSATDRAVGGLSSGSASKSVNIYVQLSNNGSAAISNFNISYGVEKYRNGSNAAGFSIQMYYSTDGSTWTSAGSNFLTSFTADANNNGYASAPGTTVNVSSQTLNVSLAAASSIYLAWNYSVTSGSETSNAQALGIDNVSITANSGGGTPTITVTPSTLSGLTYIVGSGPSTPQDFFVSGENLTNDISIAAPTNYEIKKSSDGSYSGSVTLTPISGSISSTTMNVRLKAGLSAGSYNNEIINITSTDASPKTVTCSGSVTTPPAPSAPTTTSATQIGTGSFVANWNQVAGATGYRLDVYTKTGGGNATDLFISEYIEGSSNNKAIEIFNGTGSTVDLSNYSITKQTNGAGAFGGNLALTGTLAHGSVHIVAHSSANSSILNLANQTTGSTPLDFNGNDCVALNKAGVQIDVVGVVNQVSNWGADVTFVRKASIIEPKVTYNTSEWDSYAMDTFSYLDSHTYTGSVLQTYLSSYQNLDTNNVLSYSVTGLSPTTQYFYVVRAYDAYSQTSPNSNETSVTTANAFDYPQGVPVAGQGVTVTVTGGNANAGTMEIPTFPNTSFTMAASFVFVLDNAVSPYTITIQTDAPWGAYYQNGVWNVVEGDETEIVFVIDFNGKADVEIPIILGDQNPTLPVELSSFTAMMSAQNFVNLMWVTQSETNVNGYYVYRSIVNELSSALMISSLIRASNTSTSQTYLYTDKEVNQDGLYYYWLQSEDFDGSSSFYGPISINVSLGNNNGTPAIPQVTELSSIYPNPFNPNTYINFALAKDSAVNIKIYNARGQLIRNLLNANHNAGHHRIQWNGMDDLGNNCGSGIYYFRMQADGKSFTSKGLLMK